MHHEENIEEPGPELDAEAKPAPKKKSAAKPKPKPATYRTTTSVVYGGKRVPAGTTCDDIPAEAAKWLLSHGYLEKV